MGEDDGRCRFNCRTGRMWYYLGYRKNAGYSVPKEIIEEYYQEELRKINDRQQIAGDFKFEID